MSLSTKAFKKFREQALSERKERYTKKWNLEVSATKEIADALKSTSFIAGKFSLKGSVQHYIVGKGRTASLLAGSG